MATGTAEPADAAPPAGPGPMVPRPFRVADRRRETADTWTLALEPAGAGPEIRFGPGQFTMLAPFGKGEAAISISGDPARGGHFVHTIREVGAVSRALCRAPVGTVVGVRGPFGNAWPVAAAEGADVVLVAGGIGLAPLRPAVAYLLRHRARYGRVTLLVGGRTPGDLLFAEEASEWRRWDIDVQAIVDVADPSWLGRVGVVTQLIPSARFEPASTVAMSCGPEIMMRLVARDLVHAGVPAERIHVSLERSMHCGIGHCGHCQLGPTLICRDGPVYPWSVAAPLIAVRRL
jgi:anaerobic sulfite reductase subunit B